MTNSIGSVLARLEALEEQVVGLRRQLVASLGRTSLGEGEFSVLECRAAGQALGLMLDCIQEVVPVATLLPLPETPPWVLGSLNLRGKSIVVLDVAHRLRGHSHTIVPAELIVICTAGWRNVGLLVDEVSDILTLDAESLQDPAPGVPFASYLLGVVHQDAGTLPLIDIARLAATSLVEAREGEAK